MIAIIERFEFDAEVIVTSGSYEAKTLGFSAVYGAIIGLGTQVRILPLRPEIISFFVLILTLGQVGGGSAAGTLAVWPIAAAAPLG